jgi:hypothetical protein
MYASGGKFYSRHKDALAQVALLVCIMEFLELDSDALVVHSFMTLPPEKSGMILMEA